MPRIRLGLAVVLVAGLVSASAAQDKQTFIPKFEKDKAFFQKLTTTVNQTVKVQGGSDLNLKHEQTFYFEWVPTTVEADKIVLKMTIKGVKMTVDIGGNPITYDSTDNAPAGGNPGLADFFNNLRDASFTVTFNGKMAVQKVEGRDELLKKLASANAQMEPLLKKILTDEALREMTDPSLGITPPKEVAVGESWEKKSTLTLGPIGSYERTFKFTYKGKDPEKKDLDLIEVEPKFVYKAPTDAAEGLLFRIKGGTLESIEPKPGKIRWNPKTSRVEEADIAVKMKGILDVVIGSTETKVELFQEQKTLTQIGDKTFVPEKK